MDELKKLREIFERNLPVFSALGDGNRQQLLLLMLERERKSVGELAAQTHLSRPSISHHLKVLKEANLIAERKAGTRRYYEPIISGVEGIQELTDEIARLQEYKKGNQ